MCLRYTSKARYEGQWADNAKQGHGVYTWPKVLLALHSALRHTASSQPYHSFPVQGGLYEGEWHAGRKQGVGVRVMRSGTFKVRVWCQWLLWVRILQAAEVSAAGRQVGG